jgi:hypothetical protein
MLYTSTRAGKVHMLHEDSADKLSQVGTIDTEYGAKTMAMDPKTHNLFLSTSDFGLAAGPKGRRPAISAALIDQLGERYEKCPLRCSNYLR